MKFGVITPWPGVKNAEYEVIKRLEIVAKKLGHQCISLSNDGCILDKNHKRTDEYVVVDEQVDFVLSMHFETPKLIDVTMYQAMWNPPDFSIDHVDYKRFSDHHLMYDDLLVYDSEGIVNHAKTMLLRSNLKLDESFSFVPSVPDIGCEPNVDDPKLFYCGINWERCTNKEGRHHGLFELLDRKPYMRIYGPKKFIDIEPWKGFKSYQFPVPFDGTSMIREINECGVSLVLSSDVHRKAGAATNRLYESCAAGAVIIADDNPFVKKYFHDAALFIDYDKDDPHYTFRQIDLHVKWIKKHPEEAKKLAIKAQKIFRDKFSLESQIDMLCKRHEKRQQEIASFFYAQDDKDAIDVVVVWKGGNLKKLSTLLDETVLKQAYTNYRVVIACDVTEAERINGLLGNLDLKEKSLVIPLPIQGRKKRVMNSGKVFSAIMPELSSPYFIFANLGDIWFADHLTTLKRTFEDNPNALASYSGEFIESDKRSRATNIFEPLSVNELLQCDGVSAGRFLFSNKLYETLPSYVYDYVDGVEHYILLLSCANVASQHRFFFSKKMTFGYQNHLVEEKPLVNSQAQARFVNDLFKFEGLQIEATAGGCVESYRHEAFSNHMKNYFATALDKHYYAKKAARYIYRKFLR
jgi:hypothetical protein